MKQYFWDIRKNEKLVRERGISFTDILKAIEGKGLLDIVGHPDPSRHPNQRIYVVWSANYVYLVPFEEVDGKIRLITIIPSRKALRKYFKGGEKHEN